MDPMLCPTCGTRFEPGRAHCPRCQDPTGATIARAPVTRICLHCWDSHGCPNASPNHTMCDLPDDDPIHDTGIYGPWTEAKAYRVAAREANAHPGHSFTWDPVLGIAVLTPKEK